MKKRLFALALSVVTCLSLAACGGGSKAPAASSTSADAAASAATSTPASGTTLKVGATPAPHAEILEQVKPILAKEGITLDIVEYNDYNTPNDAVEDGSLDANYFQHITYMNNYNKDNGTHLVSVGSKSTTNPSASTLARPLPSLTCPTALRLLSPTTPPTKPALCCCSSRKV